MNKINLIILTIFIFNNTISFGQKNIFDDGRSSNKNEVAVNLSQMVNGEFGISYSRTWNKYALGLGVGYLSNYMTLPMLKNATPSPQNSTSTSPAINENELMKNLVDSSNGGYMFNLTWKSNYKYIESINCMLYFGLDIKKRIYTIDGFSENPSVNYYRGSYGLTKYINEDLLISPSIQLGYAVPINHNNGIGLHQSAFNAAFYLNVGYAF